MSFDWTIARKAIVDWLASSAGVTVGWANQDAPIPDFPAGVLRVTSVVRIGNRDENRLTTDLGQPLGEEVLIEHVGQYRMTISIQILTRQKRDGTFDWDEGSAAKATAARKALGTLAQRAAFQIAGLGVISSGDVRNLSALETEGFTDRAQLDLILGFADVLSERTGYIATALVSSDFTGADPVLDLDDEPMGEPLP